MSSPSHDAAGDHSLLVLSHPLVAFGILVWALNDHVLKQQFANWWTGKLSDAVGLVVFPLLVAAGVSKFASSPLRVGIAFTGVFFTSINVSHRADAATEWVMSTMIASELTMDPTDLFMLPAMLGAVWLWRRPAPTWRARRRTWARAVFAIGVATTVATSPDTAVSDEVAGIVVLTADAPEVSIPITLLLDGEPADDLDDVWVHTGQIFFGERRDVPTGSAVDAVIIDEADGAGRLVISLNDIELAPVQVQWSAQAESVAGGLFSGSAPKPVLDVEAPPNEFEPVAAGEAFFVLGDRLQVQELALVVEQDTDLTIAVSNAALPGSVRAVTEDAIVPLVPGWQTSITAPASCVSWPCSFSVWVTVDSIDVRRLDGLIPVFVYPFDGVQVAETIEHEVLTQSRTFRTDPESSNLPEVKRFTGEMMINGPTGLIDQGTAFVEVRYGTDNPIRDLDRDTLSVSAETTSDRFARIRPLVSCCDPLEFTLEWSALDDRDSYDAVEASAEVTVTTYSLVPIAASDIVVALSKEAE